MPMLIDVADALAGVALPVAAAHAVGEGRHLVEHRVHVGHDVAAVDDDRLRRCGARSATCSTARFSVTLILSPRNIASIRSRSPDSSASCSKQPDRLVGDAVLRVVEVDAGGLERQALAARRVVGEELAQRSVAHDRCVVRGKRLPRRARRRGGANGCRPWSSSLGFARGASPSGRAVLAAGVPALSSHSRKPPGKALALSPSRQRGGRSFRSGAQLPPPSTTSSGSKRGDQPRNHVVHVLAPLLLADALERTLADIVLERRLPVGQVRELHRHDDAVDDHAPCPGRCRSPGTASCRPCSRRAPASPRR